MPRSVVVALGSLLLLAGLIVALAYRDQPVNTIRPLVVLAAPTVRGPLENVAADYTRETGRPVVIDWGPSERLVTTARFPAAHRPADLLIPADDSFLVHARDLGLLDEWTPIARVRAVVLLKPNNPRAIKGWADLHAVGVRVAIPNESAAVGKLTREHLARTGNWYAISPRVKDVLTVTDAANAAKVGSVDAAVVWDAVAAGSGYRGQAVLTVPELEGVKGTVAVGVLNQSREGEAARAFLTYLTTNGRVRFREAGFARMSTAMPPRSDRPFVVALGLLGGVYVTLIVALLIVDAAHTSPADIADALASPPIRSAVWLSLLSSSASAVLAVWVGVPLAYLLSRFRFPGKWLVELLVDVPVVLPPLVVGLSLLLLFQTVGGRWFEQSAFPVTYAVAGVVLAQFTVVTALAVRTLRVTFDTLTPRTEDIARTLGCSRAEAFWRVTLPEARHGILAAFTLAWARALGEFGPVLVFAGATRHRTEVMPTTVFLELSVGHLESAVSVSLLMVAVAVAVLVTLRAFGVKVS